MHDQRDSLISSTQHFYFIIRCKETISEKFKHEINSKKGKLHYSHFFKIQTLFFVQSENVRNNATYVYKTKDLDIAITQRALTRRNI